MKFYGPFLSSRLSDEVVFTLVLGEEGGRLHQGFIRSKKRSLHAEMV